MAPCGHLKRGLKLGFKRSMHISKCFSSRYTCRGMCKLGHTNKDYMNNAWYWEGIRDQDFLLLPGDGRSLSLCSFLEEEVCERCLVSRIIWAPSRVDLSEANSSFPDKKHVYSQTGFISSIIQKVTLRTFIRHLSEKSSFLPLNNSVIGKLDKKSLFYSLWINETIYSFQNLIRSE